MYFQYKFCFPTCKAAFPTYIQLLFSHMHSCFSPYIQLLFSQHVKLLCPLYTAAVFPHVKLLFPYLYSWCVLYSCFCSTYPPAKSTAVVPPHVQLLLLHKYSCCFTICPAVDSPRVQLLFFPVLCFCFHFVFVWCGIVYSIRRKKIRTSFTQM